ncbi:MAG: hypothetical protein WD670_07020 [Actinomycetota bacterium]
MRRKPRERDADPVRLPAPRHRRARGEALRDPKDLRPRQAREALTVP